MLYSITSKSLDKNGIMDRDIFIEKIVIWGVRYFPRNIHMYLDGKHLFELFLLSRL